jgi:hypothetical protein
MIKTDDEKRLMAELSALTMQMNLRELEQYSAQVDGLKDHWQQKIAIARSVLGHHSDWDGALGLLYHMLDGGVDHPKALAKVREKFGDEMAYAVQLYCKGSNARVKPLDDPYA